MFSIQAPCCLNRGHHKDRRRAIPKGRYRSSSAWMLWADAQESDSLLGRQRSFQRGDQRAEIILPGEELQCEPARMLVPRPLIVWLRLLNFPLSLECRFGHQGMETHSFMRLQGIGRKHETHSYKGGKQTSLLPSAMFMKASLLVLQLWLAKLKGNAGGFHFEFI